MHSGRGADLRECSDPNVSTLSYHQLHMEVISAGILILQANFARRAVLRKVIWELAFGSEWPAFMPVTRECYAGSKGGLSQSPCSRPKV